MSFKRNKGFFANRLGDELIVYDSQVDAAHCLGHPLSLIFEELENKSPAELAQLAFPEQNPDEAQSLLEAALEQLAEKKLITATSPEAASSGMARRDFCVKSAVLLPAILTVAAPTPAQAQSAACSNETVNFPNPTPAGNYTPPAGCTMVTYTVRGAGGGAGGNGPGDMTSATNGIGGAVLGPTTVDFTTGNFTIVLGFGGIGGLQAPTGNTPGLGGAGGAPDGGMGLDGANMNGGGGGGGGSTSLTIPNHGPLTAMGGNGGTGGGALEAPAALAEAQEVRAAPEAWEALHRETTPTAVLAATAVLP